MKVCNLKCRSLATMLKSAAHSSRAAAALTASFIRANVGTRPAGARYGYTVLRSKGEAYRAI